MIQLFKTSVLASFLLLATLTSVQADTSLQQCSTRWAQDLIGKHLTRAIKEQARKQARAATVVVNSLDRQYENNRLRIQTDLDLKITHIYCG